MRERHAGPPPPPPPHAGTVEGRITIVQEERFRLMDANGRGYLFVTRKGAASLDQLDAWRDRAVRVVVEYYGVPDVGALARRVRPT